MSGGPDDRARGPAGSEGWEGFAEEASEGSLGPSAELEEAMREAEAAHDARAAERRSRKGHDAAADAVRAELEALDAHFAEKKWGWDNARRLAEEREKRIDHSREWKPLFR